MKYASKRWHYREREAGGVWTLACGSLPREQIGSAHWRLREKPSKVYLETRSVYNFRGPQLPGRGHLGEVWEGGPQSRREQNTSRSPNPKKTLPKDSDLGLSGFHEKTNLHQARFFLDVSLPTPGGRQRNGRQNRASGKPTPTPHLPPRFTGHEPEEGAVTALLPKEIFWKILFQEGS